MRLIDADALVDDITAASDNAGMGAVIARTLIRYVKRAPTIDAVPVVRCRECEHCDPESMHCDHPMGTTVPFSRKTTDYCSYGERREVDGE